MSTPGHRNSLDWTLFAVLTVLWALAYPGNRLAVNMSDPAQGFPPHPAVGSGPGGTKEAASQTAGCALLRSMGGGSTT